MKIKRFNEAESYDLSFDGFKDIMSDITDDIKGEYTFNDYDERLDPNLKDSLMMEPEVPISHWYECLITLRDPEFPISDDINRLDYNFLDEREGGIPFIEDPEIFSSEDIRRWIVKVGETNNDILNLKSKIDNQVEKNTEISKILIKLSKLQTRFRSFDNFKESRIGFDSSNGHLSIFFELI